MEYEDYQRALAISKHNLDSELEVQAVYQEQIADELTHADHQCAKAKQTLAQVEGRLTLDHKLDDPKANKEIVEARVIREAEYRNALSEYQDKVQEQSRWHRLLESWRQRGFSLKTLADLYSSQYFAIDSTQRSSGERGSHYRPDSKPPRGRIRIQ